jgi:hypothetical protein
MSGFGAVVSVFELVKSLKDSVAHYNKNNTINHQIANFLTDDAKQFMDIFEKTSSLTPTSLAPILEEIDDIPSKTQIDAIVAIGIEVQIKFSALLNSFIKIVQGCSQISKNEAFMKNLMETEPLIHDFVLQMKSIYKEEDNSVKIGEDYYGFFKLYKSQLIKKYNKTKVESAVEEGKQYMQIIKKKIIPYLSANSISRENKKRFRNSFEILSKVSRRVIIKKSVANDFYDYVMPELRPIVILLEEIFLDVEKDLKMQKYQKLHPTKDK